MSQTSTTISADLLLDIALLADAVFRRGSVFDGGLTDEHYKAIHRLRALKDQTHE